MISTRWGQARSGGSRGRRHSPRLGRKHRRRWTAATALALATWVTPAGAALKRHLLVIGNNDAMVGALQGSPNATPLRFADDDAAAVYELLAPTSRSAHLLTVMDTATQALYPELAGHARAPSRAALAQAVGELEAQLRRDRAKGERSEVLLFFSGHGSVSGGGAPTLALVDGGLDQEFLYQKILERLPAALVHVVVDACDAEAVVRPRRAAPAEGATGLVQVSTRDAERFLHRTTLKRFPHVGALLATSVGRVAHEWGELGHGVFTHELLSALRGAADVNRDGNVEYSEAAAFMSAANRSVRDPRARLRVVASPPAVNRRAALVQLSSFEQTSTAWLTNVPGGAGKLLVEDDRGRRLLTLHASAEHVTDLVVPSGATLFISQAESEAVLRPFAGQRLEFADLQFGPHQSRPRGGLAHSLRRGLFASPFGRNYYLGYVDRAEALVPVRFSRPGGEEAKLAPEPSRAGGSRRWALAGGVSKSVADVLAMSHGLQLGWAPRHGSGWSASFGMVTASAGPLREWGVAARGGWLQALHSWGPVSTWLGATAGLGAFVQTVHPGAARASPTLFAGPTFALSTRVGPRWGSWSQLRMDASVFQRDGQLAIELAPSAWFGATVAL